MGEWVSECLVSERMSEWVSRGSGAHLLVSTGSHESLRALNNTILPL